MYLVAGCICCYNYPGGMKVIGYTDVIQVFFLILGGLVATYIALTLLSEQLRTLQVLLNGFKLYAYTKQPITST